MHNNKVILAAIAVHYSTHLTKIVETTETTHTYFIISAKCNNKVCYESICAFLLRQEDIQWFCQQFLMATAHNLPQIKAMKSPKEANTIRTKYPQMVDLRFISHGQQDDLV